MSHILRVPEEPTGPYIVWQGTLDAVEYRVVRHGDKLFIEYAPGTDSLGTQCWMLETGQVQMGRILSRALLDILEVR